jgi:hypothetical protein
MFVKNKKIYELASLTKVKEFAFLVRFLTGELADLPFSW